MAENFKKIDKRFRLTNSKENAYGFRLMTDGYLIDEFKKNPIGYYMHGTPEFPREAGVLVRWDDITLEGDDVYAYPCINLNHPRGQRTVDEIESGFLNAASLGHFVVLEAEVEGGRELSDGDLKGLVVTKWYNRECSLVDIGGHYEALADLFDAQGNAIKLVDLNKTFHKTKQMEKVNLSAVSLAALKLGADASAAAIDLAIANLAATAQKVPELQTKLDTANGELAALKTKMNGDAVEAIISQGLADKKMTVAVANELKKSYAENPDGLKALVAALPKYAPVADQIENADDATGKRLQALMAKSYDDLDKAGELPELRNLSADSFNAKFKEKFGKDYSSK